MSTKGQWTERVPKPSRVPLHLPFPAPPRSLPSPWRSGDEADLRDGKDLRRLALAQGIPTVTTVAGARATAAALRAMRAGPLVQIPLQDFFPDYKDSSLE